jgi:hypothetical protein
VHTVVARFHHLSRDLAELEEDLVAGGADGARITAYTVALTLDTDTREEAGEVAKRILDGIGATRIKVTKHGAKHAVA